MIYTSYFAQIKKFPDNFEPICIARWKPKWYRGRIEVGLAPTDSLLRWWRASNKDEQAQAKFRQQYLGMLNHYSPIAVANILQTLANDKIPILLCFEKSDDFCHRHILAEWFNQHGIECEEWK